MKYPTIDVNLADAKMNRPLLVAAASRNDVGLVLAKLLLEHPK